MTTGLSSKRWLWGLVYLVCSAFGLRALALIDSTGLWSDELYTVGKSFQPSYQALLAMLRLDTHPPLYYTLIWVWGHLLQPSAITLRLFSWLAYLAGGLIMTVQAGNLARLNSLSRPKLAMAAGALMAFCSPYPVRFAIEGKGYALLVLLVSLAWWCRLRHYRLGYGLSVALAGLTHYYGLFLFSATALWDVLRGRRDLSLFALLGLIPPLLWMFYASSYLMRSGTAGWIGQPDFDLLEDTLARALGLWPFPKLLLLVLVSLSIAWVGLQQHRSLKTSLAGFESLAGLADFSGLMPSLLMLAGVIMISFWKPLAFSRYFVVLLPAFIPWSAVVLASLPLNQRGRGIAAVAAAALLISWWWHSFLELDPALNGHGARESDQFQLVSRALVDKPYRFSKRQSLFNLSDRMEVASGRMIQPKHSWGGSSELNQLLATESSPGQLWLADTGDATGAWPRLKTMRQKVEAAGYRCQSAAIFETSTAPFARVLQCQSAGPLHSEQR